MNDSSRKVFQEWVAPRREAVKDRDPREQWVWSYAWEEAWFARQKEIESLEQRLQEAEQKNGRRESEMAALICQVQLRDEKIEQLEAEVAA